MSRLPRPARSGRRANRVEQLRARLTHTLYERPTVGERSLGDPSLARGRSNSRHTAARDRVLRRQPPTGPLAVRRVDPEPQPGEVGEGHEIRNTGDAPLKTLNEYVLPAYTGSGDELPARKS